MKLKDSKLYNKKINNFSGLSKKNIKENLKQKILLEKKENINNNINNQNDKDVLISTELYLDEIKLKIDYDKIESELNKLRNINKNRKEVKSFLNNNPQLEEDFFYYSDEDEENKEKNKISEINIRNIIDNVDSKTNKDQLLENDIKNKNKKENNNNNKNLKYLSLASEKFEYGIDENGNPVNIQNFKEEILRNNNNKLIAYIILNDSNQNDKNYLIDVNGQKIERNQNGDFIY